MTALHDLKCGTLDEPGAVRHTEMKSQSCNSETVNCTCGSVALHELVHVELTES
jgi:hypothetical protein